MKVMTVPKLTRAVMMEVHNTPHNGFDNPVPRYAGRYIEYVIRHGRNECEALHYLIMERLE